jgi:hypothetical protein
LRYFSHNPKSNFIAAYFHRLCKRNFSQ